ncbi:MAG: adenosine kinase [archaeon]
MEKEFDIFGLGSAIMDILIQVDDHTLASFDLTKGGMTLVDEETVLELDKRIRPYQPVMIPGGSAANTVAGVAHIGGSAVFCGLIGDDEHGLIYERKTIEKGIASRLGHEQGLTGRAITFITPDSERTFATHFGVAINVGKEHVLEEDILKSRIAHFEGYQLEGPRTREAVLHAMAIAKKAGVLVSFDVSDPYLIKRTNADMQRIIDEFVDIVFCNEEEAKALTGVEESAAAESLSKRTKIAVVKLGKRGSIIRQGEDEWSVDAYPASPVDTTGAGDMFAAGFLYGFARGASPETCGKLGSFSAAKIVEKVGARLDDPIREEIDRILKTDEE